MEYIFSVIHPQIFLGSSEGRAQVAVSYMDETGFPSQRAPVMLFLKD